MNKFILVPKEQFEKLKENQISWSDKSIKSEISLDAKNPTFENKNELSIERKVSEEGDNNIKKGTPST